MKKIVFLIILLTTLLSAKSLTPDQNRLADSLRNVLRISDKATLSQALKSKNRAAKFIDRFLEWCVTNEKKPKAVVDLINHRIESFTKEKNYPATYTYQNIAGNPKAPVTIHFYITGSCLECLIKAEELYREVTTGVLKNKAKLIAVPFKIDQPEQYLLMADKQGKFWQYLEKMVKVEERYTPEMLNSFAADCELDQKKLSADLKDKANIEFLQKAAAEAGANGIKLSSTMLINYKMYNSYKTVEWIADAVEFWRK